MEDNSMIPRTSCWICVCLCVCVYVHMQRKQVISLPLSLPDKPNILFCAAATAAADRHAYGIRDP